MPTVATQTPGEQFREFCRKNPEFFGEIEVAGLYVTVTLWNPEKTRILRRFTLNASEQAFFITGQKESHHAHG
jgi:hypothetical protein